MKMSLCNFSLNFYLFFFHTKWWVIKVKHPSLDIFYMGEDKSNISVLNDGKYFCLCIVSIKFICA